MSDLISGITSGDIGGLATKAISFFAESSQTYLGYLYLDVLTTETLTLPSDVTKYPVEDGNEDISDHITCGNEELQIDGLVSAATSFGMEFGSKCYSKMIDAVDQLRTMHTERQTITIVTGLGQYDDFAFTSLVITRSASDKGGQWLDIKAGLRQIKKVKLKKTDLPADTASKTDSSKASQKTGKTESRTGKSGESSPPPSNGGRESAAHVATGKGQSLYEAGKGFFTGGK